MKARILFLSLIAMSMVAFTACDDDDDKDVATKYVPENYQEALKAKYPDATYVKWERKKNYYVAEFQKPQQDYDVWFGTDAKWAMTEIDYGHNLFFLPGVVNEALANSEYGTNYTIDDVAMYEYPDHSFYVIDVEPMKGGKDTYLYYRPDGTLFQTTTRDINITPDTVL